MLPNNYYIAITTITTLLSQLLHAIKTYFATKRGIIVCKETLQNLTGIGWGFLRKGVERLLFCT